MDAGLRERLDADLKEALRARDAVRTSTIRLARAALQNAEIDRRRPLTEAEVVEVLQREVKRRREAIEGFERGGRADLVQREQLELAILLGYLPPGLGEAELRRLAEEVIAEVGASSERDLGRVMGPLMRRVAGRADGRTVERIVRELLRG
ncbi:MAG: GatB/YqeY domain-containing protein [Armatimonadota bacterium]|nr:GatB/YqeY domain-containing protein [Armatimonadota bacterium]MDR7537050.1 GatB/YqeY domain-containing protein [Armatimonadota bacterium]